MRIALDIDDSVTPFMRTKLEATIDATFLETKL